MTIIKKQCILLIALSGVTILGYNGLEPDIKKRYTTESDGAYAELSSEALAAAVFPDKPSGSVDSEAYAELLNRFADMMLAKIAGTTYSGIDADDLMQECSIGLLDAARDYEPDRGASFATFASVCVGNRILDTLRSAAARKNRPNEPIDEIDERELSSVPGALSDPEARFIIEESVGELRSQIGQRLTRTENAVFFDYFNGYSYEQISARQGISVKSVDNALQRARRKLKSLFDRSGGKLGGGSEGTHGGGSGGKLGGGSGGTHGGGSGGTHGGGSEGTHEGGSGGTHGGGSGGTDGTV